MTTLPEERLVKLKTKCASATPPTTFVSFVRLSQARTQSDNGWLGDAVAVVVAGGPPIAERIPPVRTTPMTPHARMNRPCRTTRAPSDGLRDKRPCVFINAGDRLKSPARRRHPAFTGPTVRQISKSALTRQYQRLHDALHSTWLYAPRVARTQGKTENLYIILF